MGALTDILELQKALLASAMPFGYEKESGDLIESLMRPLVDEVWRDAIGNLYCHKRGRGKKLVFCSHRDVIGFIAGVIKPSGAVKLLSVGGHDPSELVNTPIRFEGGARGVIRATEGKDISSDGFGALYADIGAVSAIEASKLVCPGDIAVFDTKCSAVRGDRIMTPYADDLCGCVALILAARELNECNYDVYFLFTVGEEEGASGAQAAAWTLDPDICIAVDVSEALDEPRSEQPRNTKLGAGASITLRDGSIHSPAVCRKLMCLARDQGIPHQSESMPYGGTDASSFQDNKNGAMTAVISIPTRGVHSPAEIFDPRDLMSTAALIRAMCESEEDITLPALEVL